MQRYFQLVLLGAFIVTAVLFYQKYLNNTGQNKQKNASLELNQEQSLDENQNNLIKNLKYEVKLNNNTYYIITAELSEIKYLNQTEIVDMSKVTATFIDENNDELTVISENAVFDNSTYNTKFNNNVKVEYMTNIILSEKLDLNFNENTVTIYDNVRYEGLETFAKADNVLINLITKNIEIFMNNSNEKIEIISK